MYMGGLGEIIPNMNADECRRAGGSPTNCRTETAQFTPGMTSSGAGRSVFKCDCFITARGPAPSAPPQQPAQITVSPVIQTQVSPQISPVFQQQFQPTGSPATAGTTQIAPATGITGQSQLPPAPAPAPQAAPSYTSAVPAPVYAPPQEQQLPPMPAPVPEPASTQISIEPTPYTPAPFDWKIPAIIGAGLIGILALSKRK
jgi:hypothetical protein